MPETARFEKVIVGNAVELIAAGNIPPERPECALLFGGQIVGVDPIAAQSRGVVWGKKVEFVRMGKVD